MAKADAAPDVPDPKPQLPGTPVDKVRLTIDYAILQHFSEHLYGSPNKAIEELVANSFDARATVTRVWVPDGQVEGRVVVWDDGDSMDVDGLKGLWKIAHSPKVGTRVVKVGTRERHLIGKFGIGKLASYAVGRRISHLCKVDGRFLAVGVDYLDVREQLPDDGTDEPGVFESAILELTEDEAREYFDGLFKNAPKGADKLFDAKSFTVGVVDELKEDLDLSPGRLRMVLGNAMPLRPDFEVFVNEDPVTPRLARSGSVQWSFSSKAVTVSLKAAWDAAAKAGKVTGAYKAIAKKELKDGESPTIEFPALGRVTVDVRLFEETLIRKEESKDERSYGFFVLARGRLINDADPQHLLNDPQFGTFYRSQYVIRADGLDEDLLADRGRLRRSSRTAELEVIEQALYRASRAELSKQDDKQAKAGDSVHLLPVHSRELFRDPINALLLRQEGTPAGFDFGEPRIARENLAEGDAIARVDPAGAGFQVNATHPLFRALADVLGNTKLAARALRAFDAVAVGDQLLEGFLYDQGVDETVIERVMTWRDQLLRALATRYAHAPEDILQEVRQASHAGKARFENALAELFNLMGFVATRRGASGDEDVLVIGPTGESASRFIIDAKGSKKAVNNDDAEVAVAAGHRDKAGASLAVVVAREFAGVDKDDSAILRDLNAVEKVSIADVETLIELYHAVERFSYPLDIVVPFLAKIESPAKKLAALDALKDPLKRFDLRKALDVIWDAQQEDQVVGDLLSFRPIWQAHYRGSMELDEFKQKLAALEALSGGLIVVDAAKEIVTLRQAPAQIATFIEQQLKAS